jgi:hypothetical protein
MTRIEEIENAVASLPVEEYRQFREWFLERDWTKASSPPPANIDMASLATEGGTAFSFLDPWKSSGCCSSEYTTE